MKDIRFKGLKKKQFIVDQDLMYYIKDNIVVCNGIAHIVLPYNVELFNEISNRFPKVVWDVDGLHVVITAKAVCDNEDTFSVEKGKQIAYAKWVKKAYSIAARVQNAIKRYYLKRAKEAALNEDYLESMCIREHTYIRGL